MIKGNGFFIPTEIGDFHPTLSGDYRPTLTLEQLLTHMTDWDHTPEYLDELMPWSESMQAACGK